MKIRFLLGTFLVISTLLSCSKEDGKRISTGDEPASLALNISTQAIIKGIETEADISTLNIQTMIIELYDVNKQIIGTPKALTAAEIAAVTDKNAGLTDKSRIIIEGVSKEAVYAKIYSYQAAGQSSDDLTASVNSFQNGFAKVPFFIAAGTSASPYDPATGLITINKSTAPAPGPSTDPDHTGHKVWTLEASMSAYLARYEVKGTVTASDVVPIAGGTTKPWATIAVTGIYINNMKDKVADAAPTLIKGNYQNWGQGDWETGHPFVKTPGAGNWSNMFDVIEEAHADNNTPLFDGANTGKVSAFQIFPQGVANAPAYATDAAPHIIVRLLITPDRTVVDKAPYYAFITLKKFKVYTGTGDGTATGNYLNLVERGKVYRIDLTTLAALTPNDPDPDPESQAADFYVKVTIANWSELYLRPEL